MVTMNNWTEARVSANRHWSPDLCSLTLDAPAIEFEAGQFIRVALEIDGEIVARPYSLVNPPGVEKAEIYLNRVPGGPLSSHLFQLQPGDPIRVSTMAAGFFVLSEIPDARHLWLLATGTGIGPYLSILQTPTPWQRFDRIVLVHGAKTRQDLSYAALIQRFSREHPRQFSYLRAVTRDTGAGEIHTRITEALHSGELEQRAGIGISARESQIMLCGNPGFVAEALEQLLQRGLRKNLRSKPGQVTREIYQ